MNAERFHERLRNDSTVMRYGKGRDRKRKGKELSYLTLNGWLALADAREAGATSCA